MAGRGSFDRSPSRSSATSLDDYDDALRREAPAADAAQRRRARHLARRQAYAARSRIAASTRVRCRSRCRSGLRWAARRNRWCGPASSTCRWRSPSSAASLRDSLRYSISTARRRQRAGHDAATLGTSINVHGFVAETSQEAADTFYAAQAEVMNRIGRERGWPPTSRAQFDAARARRGRSSSAARGGDRQVSSPPMRSSASTGS